MNKREGLTRGGSSQNGIAGNAQTYASNLKNITSQLQDALLISKYRTDYEDVITDMDDLVENLMLETVLNIDMKTPQKSLEKLNALNASKLALKNVLKFMDKS